MRKLTDRGGIVGCLRGCWKGFDIGFGLYLASGLERAQGSKTLLEVGCGQEAGQFSDLNLT